MLLRGGRYIDEGHRIRTGDILIENGRIAQIGRGLKAKGAIDCTGRLIMPGLCNAHTHTASILFRGAGEDLSLYEMFHRLLFPAEAKMRPADSYIAAKMCMQEMQATGTTAIFNLDLIAEPVLKAMKETGMKGVIAVATKDQPIYSDQPRLHPEKQIAETVKLKKKLKSGPISVAFGLANERECSPELIKEVAELAEQHETKLFMHAAESEQEVEYVRRKYGKRPLAYLDSLGALENTVLIHAVHLSDQDARLLAEKSVSVVHCPRSNVALGNGLAPLHAFFDAGVNICLGTDHPMPNPNTSMLREVAFAGLAHRVRGWHVNSRILMDFATINGASIAGAGWGRIKPGAPADLAIMKPWTLAEHSLNNLVYGECYTVETTLIDGRPAVRDSKLMEKARAIYERLRQ